jgi:hypothetical protein
VITYEIVALLMVVGFLIGSALLLVAVLVCATWPALKASLRFRIGFGLGTVVALPMVIASPNWLENPRLLMYFAPAAVVALLPFLPWWISAMYQPHGKRARETDRDCAVVSRAGPKRELHQGRGRGRPKVDGCR